MEHENQFDNFNRADEQKPGLFQRLYRRRTSSNTSESMVGSPPVGENEHHDNRNNSISEEPEMKFANPSEAIPMPWK